MFYGITNEQTVQFLSNVRALRETATLPAWIATLEDLEEKITEELKTRGYEIDGLGVAVPAVS